MNQSNIFTYVELSKMVASLTQLSTSSKVKEQLKAQGAYFNIIDPKLFSAQLAHEWEEMVAAIKVRGSKINEEGQVVANAVNNTINYMTEDECKKFVGRLYDLHSRVAREFA
jgi:hypothetical protein